MPILAEKDGITRRMGDKQWKRLVGQGKEKGYSKIRNMSFKKDATGQLKETAVENVPADVTKFQQKTVAEREQENRNKTYLDLLKRGLINEMPDDYTGDPEAVRKIMEARNLVNKGNPSASGDGKQAEGDGNKSQAGSEAGDKAQGEKSTSSTQGAEGDKTANKGTSDNKNTQGAGKGSAAGNHGKKGS